jgi:hypothetical protein
MTVTADQFANFALSSLVSAISTTASSLTVQTGDGAKFPASGPFMVLAGSPLQNGSHELMKCTARVTDTLTVTRAQEGTTGMAWGISTTIQQVASAGNFSDIWNQLGQALYPGLGNEVTLPAGLAIGQSPSAWTIAGNATISTSAMGAVRLTTTTNVTGIALQSGSWSGQMVTLVNEGAYTITFASTSSLVADGSTSAIASKTARGLVWDSGTGLWYRQA